MLHKSWREKLAVFGGLEQKFYVVSVCQELVRDKGKVKVVQSCPTLCDPMDYTVHRILQARILEWVAFPFSRGSS